MAITKVDRICQNCGESFKARPADVARGWALYCSKTCKALKQEKRTGQHAAYQRTKRMSEEERMHHEACAANEAGWDGHKNAY